MKRSKAILLIYLLFGLVACLLSAACRANQLQQSATQQKIQFDLAYMDHTTEQNAEIFDKNFSAYLCFLQNAGYRNQLRAIRDIQVGDEVLAWDELQAHDNAQLAQSGQAAQTLQAAYQQADSDSPGKSGNSGNSGNSSAKSAFSPINTGASSYELKSAQRYEKVTDTVSSFKEQTLLHITLGNGQSIQATAGHPFKTLEGWRDAVLLKKGGQLLLGGEGGGDRDGQQDKQAYATITDIQEEVKTTSVFNLEVANLHTFFVGVDGVLVHNGLCTPWKNLKPFQGKTKTDGKKLYENDYTHKDMEVYDKRGNHLGSADMTTGDMTKPPVPGRTIKR